MTIEGCPKRLYKYLDPKRTDVLEHAMLRYTPLGAFNDPFEGRPQITRLSADEDATKLFAEILPQEAQRNYDSLPQETRTAIPFEQFLKLMTKFAESKKGELLQQWRELTPFTQKFLRQKFDEHMGALCLSEVPDSLLMWSHYAISHTGYVIEFDAHHSYFHGRRTLKDEFRHLRRVLYSETRPSALLSELDGPDLFLVKSSHWAYEREWRILRAFAESEAFLPAEPFPVHLFSFPRCTVKGVILGARITPDTEAAIRTALRSHKEYEDVQLKRARPDDTHFLLRLEAVAT